MKSGARKCLLVVVSLLGLWVAPARADWTTYHADAARSGVDQSSGSSPLTFAPAWTSPDLGASIYAEPLIYRGLTIIATEQNDVYALNEATGQVVWHANPGTAAGLGTTSDPGAAVPSEQLPCGDISPWVGITSTPVIDPATGTLFVVADLWDGTRAHHAMVAYNAANGNELWSKDIDQPGSTPENQLQRAALNLSGGRVLVGFGGNAGDCARPGTSYWGWLVSVSEDGSSMSAWQAPTGQGDAIWAPAGPSVDASGAVYVGTGNGSAGNGDPYDYSDAVVKFASGSAVAPGGASGSFTPSNWVTLNANDLDLGSSGTVLLPDNLAFENGKDGNGWLLSTANLGGVGGQLFEAQTGCVSDGGDAYQGGIIYVACVNGGTQALALNLSAPSHPTFSQLWKGPSDANGSPIIAGGRVWVPSVNDNVLYGLDPQTGAVDVKQSTPAMEHFTSPAASDGRVMVATGTTVEAYTIATPATPPVAPPSNASGATISGASLAGLVSGKAKLAFTVHAESHGPALTSILVALPAGLSFDGKELANGLSVSGPKGTHPAFTAKLRHGLLAIAIKSPESSVTVILHGRAIVIAKRLAREVKHKHLKLLHVIVKAIDSSGKTTRLTLTLRD